MYAYVGINKIKRGAFTNSKDPDETPHNAASHQGLRYLSCSAPSLLTVEDINSYMNQDLLHYVKECFTIAPPKIGI